MVNLGLWLSRNPARYTKTSCKSKAAKHAEPNAAVNPPQKSEVDVAFFQAAGSHMTRTREMGSGALASPQAMRITAPELQELWPPRWNLPLRNWCRNRLPLLLIGDCS